MLRPLHRIRLKRRTVRFYIAMGLALATMTSQFVLSTSTVQAETEEITVQRVGIKIEYPVSDGPSNVAWQGPGIGWFTSPSEDLIGVIVRDSASEDELISVSIQYIAEPNGSQPYDIAFADDTVWFTALGSNQLGRIDVTMSGSTVVPSPTRYYDMPFADSGPSGVAIAPDGMVWIVSAWRPRLSRFDPVTETFTEWAYGDRLGSGTVSTASTLPDIATNHPNQIWFTVPGADRMIGYEVDIDDFSVHPLNNPFFAAREPAGITVDSKIHRDWDGGYPWVTAYASNVVGRFSPATNSGWDWYRIPTPDSGPRGVAFQDNGDTWDIWFTQENAEQVGRLSVLPNYVRVGAGDLVQPAGSRPRGIATGGGDTVWYAESGRRTVSEIRPPYVLLTRLPLISVDP